MEGTQEVVGREGQQAGSTRNMQGDIGWSNITMVVTLYDADVLKRKCML